MADKDPAIKKLGDNVQFMRVLGSMPWLKPVEKDRHRTKIFKSGNSLAVRIPAGTSLKAGMEMELTVEDGVFLSYDPVEAPKRKFNIAKVAGSAKGLKYVEPKTRLFEPRPSVAGSVEHKN
jgi:antitoxin VapB